MKFKLKLEQLKTLELFVAYTLYIKKGVKENDERLIKYGREKLSQAIKQADKQKIPYIIQNKVLVYVGELYLGYLINYQNATIVSEALKR